MDKRRLNNEIILCRPAVRKARVAVIRKILKKMKILKACKLEILKEKKLKKSERLFEKVKILKKVKDDEVTKFALRIKNLETFLSRPKLDLRQSALAYLAKHEAVTKKINFIRELIPNWETELPVLLNSIGKNKKKKLSNKTKIIKTDINTVEVNKRVCNENKVSSVKKNIKDKENILKKMTKPANWEYEVHSFHKGNIGSDENKESKGSCCAEKLHESVKKVKKVDDPFFIDKKIIASKLMLKSFSSEKDSSENLEKACIKKKPNSLVFHRRPFKAKKDFYKFMDQKFASEPKEENLHPSWAAKKIKLIKPFQGTKIKFSND